MKKFEGNKNLTGSSIKRLREEKRVSRQQLAIKLELLAIYLTRNDIYRIEKNILPIKDFELLGIAKVLNLDLNDFKELLE